MKPIEIEIEIETEIEIERLTASESTPKNIQTTRLSARYSLGCCPCPAASARSAPAPACRSWPWFLWCCFGRIFTPIPCITAPSSEHPPTQAPTTYKYHQNQTPSIPPPFLPVLGPVPPPTSVVRPAASASSACCGQMKCTCVSTPPVEQNLWVDQRWCACALVVGFSSL